MKLSEARYFRPSIARDVQDRVDLEWKEWILVPGVEWKDIYNKYGWGEWEIDPKDHNRVIHELTDAFGQPYRDEDDEDGHIIAWSVEPTGGVAPNSQKYEWSIEYIINEEGGGQLLVHDTI